MEPTMPLEVDASVIRAYPWPRPRVDAALIMVSGTPEHPRVFVLRDDHEQWKFPRASMRGDGRSRGHKAESLQDAADRAIGVEHVPGTSRLCAIDDIPRPGHTRTITGWFVRDVPDQVARRYAVAKSDGVWMPLASIIAHSDRLHARDRRTLPASSSDHPVIRALQAIRTPADMCTHPMEEDPQGSYEYHEDRPAVATDAIVTTIKDGIPHLLVIQRKSHELSGTWALPGGFVHVGDGGIRHDPVQPGETMVHAAARECQEETGVVCDPHAATFVGWFDQPDRDPRTRVVSGVYRMTVPYQEPRGSDDASAAKWMPVSEALAMPMEDWACDHGSMVRMALAR
jgi:8-oxo-dGTP diphosphatase